MPKPRMITYDGKTQSLADWARELGINLSTLSMRLNSSGWTIEETLTKATMQRCGPRPDRAGRWNAAPTSGRSGPMTRDEADAYYRLHASQMTATELAIATGVSAPEVRRRCHEIGLQWYSPPLDGKTPAYAFENFCAKPQPPNKRLPSLPGSMERIAELRRRASDGEELFGEADSPDLPYLLYLEAFAET